MNPAICLVDDDDLFRQNLAEGLRALGQPVDEAHGVRECLALLERRAYAAAIVDVLMPEIDGIELIRRIRATWPDMRVIAITGGGRLSADMCADLAQLSGADASLRKPLTAEDIMAQIQPPRSASEL